MRKISSFMGPPPNQWQLNEVQQIKRIQRCYKAAYDTSEDVHEIQHNADDAPMIKVAKSKATYKNDSITSEMTQRVDTETFLPKHSPLRSEGGEKKQPAYRPFVDHEDFIQSCRFEFWRDRFDIPCSDKFIGDSAQSMVIHICKSQGEKQLKGKRTGRFPSIPSGIKRDHITPVVLVLHELKLWAINTLLSSEATDSDVVEEVKCRMKYLDFLSSNDVWGDEALQKKLVRLFGILKGDMRNVHDHCVRIITKKSSKARIEEMETLLRDVVLNEMKLVSARMNLTQKLSDPRTPKLNPTDLFKPLDEDLLDWNNFVHVLFWKMGQLSLVQSTLTGDYGKLSDQQELDLLAQRNNLFWLPGATDYIRDKTEEFALFPEAYRPTFVHLQRLIRAQDAKASIPNTPTALKINLKKTFWNDENVSGLMKVLMKNLGAIQEMIPCIYMFHLLGELNEESSFTIYDCLKVALLDLLKNVSKKLNDVRDAEAGVARVMEDLVSEEAKKALKKNQSFFCKRRPYYKPSWASNHGYVSLEMIPDFANVQKELVGCINAMTKEAKAYKLEAPLSGEKMDHVKRLMTILKPIEVKEESVRAIPVEESVRAIPVEELEKFSV